MSVIANSCAGVHSWCTVPVFPPSMLHLHIVNDAINYREGCGNVWELPTHKVAPLRIQRIAQLLALSDVNSCWLALAFHWSSAKERLARLERDFNEVLSPPLDLFPLKTSGSVFPTCMPKGHAHVFSIR